MMRNAATVLAACLLLCDMEILSFGRLKLKSSMSWMALSLKGRASLASVLPPAPLVNLFLTDFGVQIILNPSRGSDIRRNRLRHQSSMLLRQKSGL
jgi:hypothetical protein